MGVLQLILGTTGEKITAALHLNQEICQLVSIWAVGIVAFGWIFHKSFNKWVPRLVSTINQHKVILLIFSSSYFWNTIGDASIENVIISDIKNTAQTVNRLIYSLSLYWTASYNPFNRLAQEVGHPMSLQPSLSKICPAQVQVQCTTLVTSPPWAFSRRSWRGVSGGRRWNSVQLGSQGPATARLSSGMSPAAARTRNSSWPPLTHSLGESLL